MCWTSRYSPKLKTAEEDVKVKKILLKIGDSLLLSPCKTGFKWELGKVYENELGEILQSVTHYYIYIMDFTHVKIYTVAIYIGVHMDIYYLT